MNNTHSRRAGIPPLTLLLITLASPSLDAQTVILRNAFPSLAFPSPVDLQHAGDGSNRLFVVGQQGVISVVDNSPSASSSKTFLDIDSIVHTDGELGLLGLAFHPSYDSNGYFFVNYNRTAPLRTVVSRFSVSATDPDSADPASEVVFLEYAQPYDNHNGGQLAFGPDGYLYIASGDGGSGGDPQNRAQDRTTLLGKILRIDVDLPADTLNYSIPPGNPYADNVDGFREEIYAYGLRNPWRFSFDRVTGKGWMGDVGQGDWEEIDTLTAGGNYGWRLKEGAHCYNPPAGCDTIPGLIDPVWEYPHDAGGGCSVTGGYVYRGSAIPSLRGKFLYGDYCTGRIWALDTNGAGGWVNALVLDSNRTISSFGTAPDGEMFICSPGDGRIYRLLPLQPPVPSPVSPADGSTGLPSGPELRWSASGSAIRYHLEVADNPGFATPVVSDTALADTAYAFTQDGGSSTWYWRVRARNEIGWSPFSAAWSFSTDTSGSEVYPVEEGWNIVSLPLDVPDPRTTSVFPAAISPAYRYDPPDGYLRDDTLDAGTGYWLKFAASQAVALSGPPRVGDTLAVAAGWNLIGGLNAPVAVDSIVSVPPGIVVSAFFGYKGAYAGSALLEPARGYWVKISEPGFLLLEAPGSASRGAGFVRPTAGRD